MNVTHGHGLTFNIAERVQSYTHPLWLLLLTGAYLVVGNVYYAAFLVSIGVSLAVFWLALRQAAHPDASVDRRCGPAGFSRVRGLFDIGPRESAIEPAAGHVHRPRDAVTRGVRLPRDRGVDGGLVVVPHARPDNVLLVAPVLVWLTVRGHAMDGRGRVRH